jgi:hypothetical protein
LFNEIINSFSVSKIDNDNFPQLSSGMTKESFCDQHPIYHLNLVDKMEFYPTKKGMFSQKYLVITGDPRKSPVKTVFNLLFNGVQRTLTAQPK